MAFDPRHLEAFLAVVEHGSLGRAAEAVSLTQPALSRIIRRLETQLGVTLFERRATGMELTTYGQALLPHARLMRAQAAQAIEEIGALRGLSRGTLRIGAVASAVTMILPAVIERLLGQWPGLRVHILEAVEDRLATALTANEIDVAIAGEIREMDDIERIAENEFTDCTTVIASSRHPLRRRTNLTVHDLLDQHWVMPPRDAVPRQQFERLMIELGVTPPEVAVETRSPSSIKALVARTWLLGWLPQPLFAAEQAAHLIAPLPVEGLTMHRRFFVYRRRRGFTPPALLELLKELRRTALVPSARTK